MQNTFTLEVKEGNEIRRTGEAFDSFVAFATLHKEPLYFFWPLAASQFFRGVREDQDKT